MPGGPEGASMRIVVGVTGGIAAYKAVAVVRELVRLGHQVTVIPTHSALKFVGLPTWEAISRQPVPRDLFDGVADVTHVRLGQQADLVIVAPAGAHFLAQYAGGHAGDLLLTTLLATEAPVMLAPAMHTEMWNHPATVANLATLASRGVHFVGPESGQLTGDDRGPGRMSEPGDIVSAALARVGPLPLHGKTLLISGGGTREQLDPVRFIGNRSTGAMAVAIAERARDLGARVVFVHAALDVALPRGVESVEAMSAAAMHEEMRARQVDADIVIMAAAVADVYAPKPHDEKAPRGEEFSLPELQPTTDIAADLGQHKPEGQVFVTFSAETLSDDEELLSRARSKAEAKGADVVVANRVGWEVGFGQTETAVWIIQRSGAPVLSTGSKPTVAGHLMDVLLSR